MKHFETYLKDHFAGAQGALQLLRDIGGHHPPDRLLCDSLHGRISQNKDILHGLMVKAGFHESGASKLLGKAAAALGQLRFRYKGLEAGSPGYLEAWEVLSLGVQGQCLLWRSLAEVRDQLPAEGLPDFTALIQSAEVLRTEVEDKRMEAFLGLGRA